MKPLRFEDVKNASETGYVMPTPPDLSDLVDKPLPPRALTSQTSAWTPPVFEDMTDLTPSKLVEVLNARLGVAPEGTKPIFLDTETIGFHGIAVLIQFAIGSGEVILWETLRQPIGDTIELIEMFATWPDGIVGFNLAFDWFHLQKLHSVLCRLRDLLRERGHADPDRIIPVKCLFELEGNESFNDYVDELGLAESQAFDYPCIKPVKACDLMLYARKGPYQITMERKPIYLRNIPTLVAEDFCNYLNEMTDLPDILFAGKKKESPPWKIKEAYCEDGTVDPDFVNLELSFRPSGSLKDIAKDLGIVKDVTYFDEISPNDKWPLDEEGYSPYAMSPYIKDGKLIEPGPGHWGKRWPTVVRLHAEHWAIEPKAKKYARDDVIMTRGMYYAFKRPALGDVDSTLACMVGSTRWRGFAIDKEAVKKAYLDTCKHRDELSTGLNLNSPAVIKNLFTKACRHCTAIPCDCATDSKKPDPRCPKCRGFGHLLGYENDPRGCTQPQHTDPSHPHYHKYEPVITKVEQILCKNRKNRISFGKRILEKMEHWTIGEVECDCFDFDTMCFSPSCLKCGGAGIIKSNELHPAAKLVKRIKDYRVENYRAELLQKLLLSGRLHIDLSVTGTLSNRMAGASGLNAQGIPRDKAMRICIKFAFPGFALCGGDFDGFEVAIAEAVYKDKRLYEALTTGKKVHAIAGARFYAPMTYDEVLATKDTLDDYYSRSKQGFFALLYGGTAQTLVERCQIALDKALAGFNYFMEYFEDWGKARQKLQFEFSTLIQQNIRQPIIHKTPRNSISSLLGHTRYFTVENSILEMLYQLAQRVPTKFLGHDRLVMRRGRQVTVTAAIRSALTASSFSIQNSIIRAAANHEVQSTGAELTKKAQVALWDLQPSGTHEWVLSIFNFHDELNAAVRDDMKHKTKEVIDNFITEHLPLVRCLKMEWKTDMRTWADK